MTLKPALHTMAVAIAVSLACNAHALPANPKPVHPRLYATATELAALKARFPSAEALPQNAGTIKITIKPAARVSDDAVDAVIFGTQRNATNALMVRHLDRDDTATTVKLQIGFIKAGATSYVAHGAVVIPRDQVSTVTIKYNSVAKTASLSTDQGTQEFHIPSGTFDWTPGAQQFDFMGRAGDVVSNITVYNGNGVPAWQRNDIDYELGGSMTNFLWNARAVADKINDDTKCPVTATPVADKSDECNVATAGRNMILATAKKLALAYKLSNDPVFVTAAQKYVRMMLEMKNHEQGVKVGIEWSMGARVGAMGVLYDWFFTEMNTRVEPNNAASPTYRTAIQQAIKDTIAADITTGREADDDLIAMACGNLGLTNDATTFDCAGDPDLSRSYLSGHQASAQTGVALGLLAIVDEKPEVLPMIDTIYQHVEKGQIPVREFVSVDGGGHTMYSYNASVGEQSERLIMWRRALATAPDQQLLKAAYEEKVVLPYIYALRKDAAGLTSFPGSGDNFDMTANEASLGYMSLLAANAGNGTATAFYQQFIRPSRTRRSAQLVWDMLYFPGTPAPATPVSALPLSARFSIAGNVYMRDSWDYHAGTLLDFKSTSFISENHQHLDQNSYALFHRAPLLLDSGAYDEYNTMHWYNYYRRTIAHNSIVVFDPNENFDQDGKSWANDGGQWFGKRPRYPTLAEIQPGGSNALDGVTHFEEGGRYAFATGNASKAYSASKLDQVNGFLRSIVFLRPDAKVRESTILVFDRVRTLAAGTTAPLAATSLLHSATRPATAAAQTHTTSGRYTVPSNNAPLAIRNGGGMVTVEPLLPLAANIVLAGGTSTEGRSCDQVADVTSPVQTVYPYDCRFTARRKVNNAWVWSNFAPWNKFNKTDVSDVGNWRIEITTQPAAGQPVPAQQLFLNVLRVADTDNDKTAPATSTARLLSDGSNGTVAVAVNAATTVAFAASPTPATTLSWKAENAAATILATGLKPSSRYAKNYDSVSGRVTLTETTGVGYDSSSEGVVNIVNP